MRRRDFLAGIALALGVPLPIKAAPVVGGIDLNKPPPPWRHYTGCYGEPTYGIICQGQYTIWMDGKLQGSGWFGDSGTQYADKVPKNRTAKTWHAAKVSRLP
jgi:hypothetical protein